MSECFKVWTVLPSQRLREATTTVPVILVVVFQGTLIKVSAGTRICSRYYIFKLWVSSLHNIGKRLIIVSINIEKIMSYLAKIGFVRLILNRL